MTRFIRRAVLTGAAASLALAACGNGIGSQGGTNIDARADAALNYLDTNYPGTRDLRDKSVGMLVMPLVTEASFGFGGSYGRGVLRVNDIISNIKGVSLACHKTSFHLQDWQSVL